MAAPLLASSQAASFSFSSIFDCCFRPPEDDIVTVQIAPSSPTPACPLHDAEDSIRQPDLAPYDSEVSPEPQDAAKDASKSDHSEMDAISMFGEPLETEGAFKRDLGTRKNIRIMSAVEEPSSTEVEETVVETATVEDESASLSLQNEEANLQLLRAEDAVAHADLTPEFEVDLEDMDCISEKDLVVAAAAAGAHRTRTVAGEVTVRLSHSAQGLSVTVVDARDAARPGTTSVMGAIRPQAAASASSLPAVLAYSVHVGLLQPPLPSSADNTGAWTVRQRLKTKMRQGPDPFFDETVRVTKSAANATCDVKECCLRLRLYGSLRNSMTTIIGEGHLPLADLDLQTRNQYRLNLIICEPPAPAEEGWQSSLVAVIPCVHGSITSLDSLDRALSASVSNPEGPPELLVSLAFNAQTGRLTVELLRGNKFPKFKENKLPDTFIKLSMMGSHGEELESCKTTVRKACLDPVFEEKFVFQVMVFQMGEVSLMVSGHFKLKMNKKIQFGSFLIGNKGTTDEEKEHWRELNASKNSDPIVRWHNFERTCNEQSET